MHLTCASVRSYSRYQRAQTEHIIPLWRDIGSGLLQALNHRLGQVQFSIVEGCVL